MYGELLKASMANSQQELTQWVLSRIEHFTRLNTIIQRESAFDRAIAEFVEKLPQERFCVDSVPVIAVSELRASIQALKKTSPGEDCVSNVMLKKLPSNMFYEVVSLFNTSLVSSSVPASWKQGITVPALKPNKDPASVSSYRPITMLSCIGKLVERIIQRRLDHFLENKHIFPPTQTGFCRGRSITDVLAILKQGIGVCKLKKQYCLISYLDIDGVFVSVWHQGLLFKMKQLDIPQYILSWLCDYLTGRTIRARVGVDLSLPKPLTIGLPQGAVLSPTLFNVMLSDISNNENVKVLSYAEDITLLTMAYDFQTAKGNMQNYLNELTKRLMKWKFKENPQKCSFHIYTNMRIIPFTLSRTKSSWHSSECTKAQMVPHIKYLKNDCLKRINVIRAISSCHWGASRVLLRKVYIAYIRSKIEYGSVIYGEFPASHMHKLDVIQNSVLRYILGARKTSPIGSLEVEAHISPLEIRFRYLSMKWYYRSMYSPSSLDHSDNAGEVGLLPVTIENTNFFSHSATALFSLIDCSPLRRVPSYHISPVPPHICLGSYICTDLLGYDAVCAAAGMMPGLFNSQMQCRFTLMDLSMKMSQQPQLCTYPSLGSQSPGC